MEVVIIILFNLLIIGQLIIVKHFEWSGRMGILIILSVTLIGKPNI